MKSKILVGIIDIGYGNLSSVKNALKFLKFKTKIIKNSKNLDNFSHLILPGVGSFNKASQQLKKNGWKDGIYRYLKKKKPLLGICLGMQLLFKNGYEDGISEGLNVIHGTCNKFEIKKNFPVPHMGFNLVKYKKKTKLWKNIPNDSPFYFVHSFRVKKSSAKYELSATNYGEEFVSAVENQNIIGVQFHPEKSHKNGLQLLNNFITGYSEL